MDLRCQGFFEGAKARDMVIGWGILGAPIAALLLLGALFLKTEPIRRQQVIGCYTAAGAPTLHIRFDAIYVGDSRQSSFTYIAEPYKAGYHLAVNPALGLHPISTGGYDFLPDRGIGYFWELLPNGMACCRFGGHRDKVFSLNGEHQCSEGSSPASSSLRR